MADLSAMSDDQLKAAYAQSAPEDNSLASMSDKDLQDAYYKSVQQQHIMSGVTWDEYVKEAPLGRVLQAFGQGASDGWGVGNLGLSPETEEGLKRAGIFPDVQKGQGGLVRAFNEAVIRPAATVLDAANRAASAVFRGGQAAVAQIGAEVGAPEAGRGIAMIPEAFAGELGGLGIPRPEGVPGAVTPTEVAVGAGPGSLGYSAHFTVDLPEAHALHVIGSGESGWLGTTEPKPPPEGLTREAVQAAQDQPPSIGDDVPQQAPPAPDIHQVARQIAPETFQEYDSLSGQRDLLRQRLADAQTQVRQNAEAQAPHAAEIADLQQRLQDTTPRLAKKYEARLAEMIPERDAFLADDSKMAPLLADTPEMERYRRLLQETDYRMRDLAPDVTAAYRQAAEQFPEPEPAPVAAPAEFAAPEPTPEPAAPEAAPVSEAPLAAEPESTPAPEAQPPAPPVNIAQDTAQKLIAAGRPEDEANAAAAIVQAHYEARAARFGGAKGTPEALYQAEAPDVQGGTVGGRKGAAAGKAFIKGGRSTITLFQKADASTFMHEVGHHWLEELLSDAKDDAAPQSLRDDAATVRKWLGADEEGAITTRQHERFAKGFERYLMEGRAPSRALDGIFAQFRQWLTSIYQKVKLTGSPINDDIRDVFDRLIATNPERAVVAPEEAAAEEPTKPALPGISERQKAAEAVTSDLVPLHHADVEATPAPEAGKAADQIRDEVRQTVEIHAPEVLNDLGGIERAGEVGGRGEAPVQPGGASGSSEPVGVDVENSQQSVGINESGNRITPQGDRVRVEPAERPTTAAGLYGPPATNLIDKAGNIRLDNLHQPEDVNAVLRETASENGDFLGARRGVLSDPEVLDLADALGMDAKTLNARKIGQAFNAEEVIAARRLLIQSANDVRDKMALAATGSDAEVMAYAEAKTRHRMIQEQVSGITAEAGRALRAFRSLGEEGASELQAVNDFVRAATGRTLFQLRAEAKAGIALETPGQVSKFVADSVKPTFTDMLLEYWINGLISGPATHTTYTVGNVLLAMWKAVPETAVASAIGAARRALGDTAPAVMPGEVGAGLYGILKGQREGIMAAGQAAKTGLTTTLPGERIADFALQNGPRGAIPGVAGEVIRLPSRGVATIHSYFRAIGYSQAKAQLAYRQAASEGLSGDAFTRRVAELSTNPSEDMMRQARDAATEQTLMGRGGEFTQTLASLADKPIMGAPLLKFVMPFVKIGANIMSQALLERTPLGFVDPEIRANLMGRNGAVARDTQIARIAVGTAVGAMTISLAAQGFVTGGGPQDPKEAAIWRLAGNQPYSVRIGDTWYGVHRLGPLAVILGLGADMYELGHAVSTDQADNIAGLMVGSITKGLLDETWMRGPSELIQALEDPARYGARWARDEISSFVPFSVGMSQIARATDPYSRQARTILDSIRAKVPGLSEGLQPRIDVWGQPIPNMTALGIPGLSAIYESHVNNDLVNQTLLRLHAAPSSVERQIRGVQLSDQQYTDYATTAGRMTKSRLDILVRNPGFSALPGSLQVRAIRDTVSHSREQARALMMMRYPQIIRDANAAKKAQLAH